MTNIGIVGCGFVADYYLSCLEKHPELSVIGLYDKDANRSKNLAKHYGLTQLHSLNQLLNDPKIEIILNLTNPRNHYEISKASLEAGKHVYTEKPLAMEMKQAQELYELARMKDKYLAAAPCNLLGESAQTLWKAIREKKAGTVRLVYCELDDGPVYLMHPENWKSKSGTPWPVKDEFEVGCSFEHAGYYLTWLIAFFGSAESVAVTSYQAMKNKCGSELLEPQDTPDFSVACIKFSSGPIARLTCSITAPHNHSIKIIGDKGVLGINECWHYASPVTFMPFTSLSFRAAAHEFINQTHFLKKIFGLIPKKIPFVKNPGFTKRFTRNYMDYARGVSELASAIKEKRKCRLSPELALHVNEIICAIYNAKDSAIFHRMTTSCGEIDPMDWAK